MHKRDDFHFRAGNTFSNGKRAEEGRIVIASSISGAGTETIGLRSKLPHTETVKQVIAKR